MNEFLGTQNIEMFHRAAGCSTNKRLHKIAQQGGLKCPSHIEEDLLLINIIRPSIGERLMKRPAPFLELHLECVCGCKVSLQFQDDLGPL